MNVLNQNVFTLTIATTPESILGTKSTAPMTTSPSAPEFFGVIQVPVSCGILELPLHVTRTPLWNYHPVNVTFGCDDGYSLIGDTSTTSCGLNGSWTDTTGYSCIANVSAPSNVILPQNLWTMGLTAAQGITEHATVAVTQNEWILTITAQAVTESAGVVVTQGSKTGTLKTALTGADMASVVISTDSFTDIFDTTTNVIIGGTTVALDTVNAATKSVSNVGTLKTSLFNEWTMAITSQSITENANVVVSQNEWTFAITSQVIAATAGVTVTQGSITGLLKTTLSGAQTSIVISSASGIFVDNVDVVIGEGGTAVTVAHASITTATKTQSATGTLKTAVADATTSVVIQAASGDTFVTTADLIIGSTTVAFANVNTATNR